MLLWHNGLVGEEKRKPNVECRVCKTPIYRRPGVLALNKGNAYCSQTCYGKSQHITHPCVVCGSPILASANKKTCSRACANKNRAGIKYTGNPLKDKVKDSRQLRSRLFKLRGKECERCSYEMYQILQVHHRDRNRENNSLRNLELLCPNCHAKEHYMKK